MSTSTNDGPEAALERLRQATRVLVTGHRSPDGDCLGSALALASLAEALGTDSSVVLRDSPPMGLRELPGIDRLQVLDAPPLAFPDDYDLVLAVECPGLDRAGLDGLDRVPVLNIDHHPDNGGYGTVNYLDADAPAVGEMVWQLFPLAGVKPTTSDATNLYVALVTDTGDFRYSNATPRAFRAAAEMVTAGADPAQVARWVHASRSEGSVRLLGEALRTLELVGSGRVAVMSLDPEAFARAGATPEDTDDLVNVPRSIAGVHAVAFLKQWEAGPIRVSLRSVGDLDVRRIAASHGGGGHANAAGCTISGDLQAARRQMRDELLRLVDGGA